MVTVSAETALSSSPDEIWTALGRRNTYFYFPGIAPATGKGGGRLAHALALPMVDRQEQTATLSVGRAGRNGRRERRFTLRGELVTVAGRWQLEPGDAAVRVRLTLDYEIAPELKTLAGHTLRTPSPPANRTHADACLHAGCHDVFGAALAQRGARPR